MRGFRHFFVLAPNLTIYDKLIRDFTPNTPKYVFQGIGEFATNPPEIITGDTWESGRGVRRGNLLESDEIHVNIFNISKINSEVRGGKAPRIKRLHEYIGQSYFDYLSGLKDLVLLMDESHRYRATAGAKAINELKPILGLELTATPQIESGADSIRFKNIIFSYPLSSAMEDGFVKEPAVATRKDFDPKKYDEGRLEKLKLEDGIRIHEETKVKLDIYSRERGAELVKPFVLVVARDVAHAEALAKQIEDPGFFEGRYKGKVITVHSGQTGVEKDETIAQLINVEKADNPTEIVIHVNMLKEGWDVTNLFTIIPLRKADSKTLVEQSIGRGLRLPYGRRTGVPEVDRLTIVSHDRFQEIVEYANNPDSLIRGGIKVVYVGNERSKIVEARPALENALFGAAGAGAPAAEKQAQPALFTAPAEQEAARAVLKVIQSEFSKLPQSADLKKPEVLAKIEERVRLEIQKTQPDLPGAAKPIDLSAVVRKTVGKVMELSIDIPRITVQPIGDADRRYAPFKLDLSKVHYQPVEQAILIRELQSRETFILAGVGQGQLEDKLENYIVRRLMDFDDICYDVDAEVLYDLAGQVIAHLTSYLKDAEKVRNVVLYFEGPLAELVHAQMQAHVKDVATSFTVHVSRGFVPLPTCPLSTPEGETDADFRQDVEAKSRIPKMVFTGFQRCLYDRQRFHSDPERRFAVLLERKDSGVQRWLKPPRGVFRIIYYGEEAYEPDFVVELADRKLLCEVKDDDGVDDKVVQEKARAAAAWCEYANKHAEKFGGKLWSYLLIPESDIKENSTLQGIEKQHTFSLEDDVRKKIKAYGLDLPTNPVPRSS